MRLYAPSIALFLWAIAWAIGIRGDAVVVLGLVTTGVAVLLHIRAAVDRLHGKVTFSPQAKRVRRVLRENWYRDVWLLAITALVVLALLSDQDVQDTLVHNQRCDLENRIAQSEEFLEQRGDEEPVLADYIRKTTLPDLRERLEALPADGDCTP